MEEQKQTAMEEREETTGNKWVESGDGYFVLEGSFFAKVIYIAIPKDHPLCNPEDYLDFDVEVNGGLTFNNDNVFGWDYNHLHNGSDYKGDTERAIEYFKSKSDVLEKNDERGGQ